MSVIQQPQRKPFAEVLASLLFMCGVIAVWLPSMTQLLPRAWAEPIHELRWFLFAGGALWQGYLLWQRVKHAQASSLQARAEAASMQGKAKPADPALTGLPAVDWTPLKGGGSNFKTQNLIEQNPQRLAIKASNQHLLFCLFFAGFGGGIGGLIGFVALSDGAIAVFPFALGALFVAAGWGLWHFGAPAKYFDQHVGWYWQGPAGCQASQLQLLASKNKATPLDAIRAVQVLAEHISSNDGPSYDSLELNLLLADGQRLNVMDHGDRDSLINAAQQLASFLNVPLLNGREQAL